MKGRMGGVGLAASIFLAAALYPVSGFGQSGAFTFTPLVRRGDPSPNGGGFFDCRFCEGRINGSHALNNIGNVAVVTDTVGPGLGPCQEEAYLLGSGTPLLLGDGCTPTPDGLLSGVGESNVSGNGQAVFHADFTRNRADTPAIYIYPGGRMTRIFAARDTTADGVVTGDCGFGEPVINSNGEVVFEACGGLFVPNALDSVCLYSGGVVKTIVKGGDPSPLGGFFALSFFPAVDAVINDNGDILFQTGHGTPGVGEQFGLFLHTADGFKKIVLDGDPLPNGESAAKSSLGLLPTGDLNAKGDVAFTTALTGTADTGIFLYSGGTYQKIMAAGDPSPSGGIFSTLADPDLTHGFSFAKPRINSRGAVAFVAKAGPHGKQLGIFLASPRAMVKVVGVGDNLPGAGTIGEINTFALNDLGQVVFFAYGAPDQVNPFGIYMASPVPPSISAASVKHPGGAPLLIVKGGGFITNDSIIEVDGQALAAMDYPVNFRHDGGTAVRVESADPRLGQLIPAGQPVRITVFNPLTGLRSAPLSFTR